MIQRSSFLAIAAAIVAIALLLVLRNAVVDEPLDRLERAEEADGTHYRGHLYLPRGGPYILGFEAPEPAELVIDGKHRVRGKGLRDFVKRFPWLPTPADPSVSASERIVLQAGSTAIDFRAPDGARLLWHPPGRRGPLEYLPASALSTEADGFDSSAGTSRADGAFALAIVLVLASLLGFVCRRTLARVPRREWLVLALVFGLALLVRCIGLGDQGQTWDEDVNWSAGRNYMTNLLSLDFSKSAWSWNYEHPPVMKYLAGLGAQFSDGYGVSRFLSAVTGSLACVLIVLVARRLVSARAGLVAGLLCALTPHLIAHSQIVGHEAPTLFFWALAIWLSLRVFDGEVDQRVLARRLAILGAMVGLAIMSRFINGLLAPLVAVIVLVQAPAEWRRRTLILGITVAPLALLVTSFAIWPRLWTEPLSALVESWEKLKKPHSAEAFLGAVTNEPSRSYFLVYLYATAPLGLLLAAGAGAVRALRIRERSSILLLCWLFVPMIVAFSPVRQDGVRYIMPSLLALNVLAAVGVESLWELGQRRWKPHAGKLWLAATVLLCGYLAITCARIRPFYLDYYGEQVGGTQAVARERRFEVAWWGEGMNEALDYLNRHAPPGARVFKGAGCFEPAHLAWMRGDLWVTEARRPEDADWFLVYQPHLSKCPVPRDAEMVHQVTAQGAVLARVFRRELARPR